MVMTLSPCALKRARLAWLIGVLCLLATQAQAQTAAPRHRVLIDRSGSMGGFFATGKIQEVRGLLRDLSGATEDSYYFIDKQLVSTSEEPTNYGGETYLKDALTNALSQQPAPAILWLITDNQPSVGSQSASDQDIADFYEGLRHDAVKRLYFFPLHLPFKGKLYREDGHSVLTPNYSGPRGLLVYALLLDERARDEFERTTNEFQSRFRQLNSGELRRILVKPLEQDTVTAQLIPGKKFRLDGKDKLIAGDFDEGAAIEGDFKINLTSRLGQMQISRGKIDVRVSDKFRTDDFTESEIKPTFDPDYIDDFKPQSEPQKEHNTTVRLKSGGVHLRPTLSSWWNCIWRRDRGGIDGKIQILITVPPENFDVVSNLTREFSTKGDIYNDASPDTQAKIANLDGLVKKMMPQGPVNIRPRVGANDDGLIPVHIAIRYPKRPAIALGFIAVLLLLVLLFSLRFFGRRQVYRLTWDSGRYRACPDFRLNPLVGQRIELDNRTAATVKKSLSGIRVRAASGYTVDERKSRLVNSNGTDFSVSQTADAGVTFYFSSVSAAFRGGSAGRADGDDIFGDVFYGNTSGDVVSNLAGGTAGAPPIRKPVTGRVGDDGSGSSDITTTEDNSSVNLDDLFP
jgi:hypothetical protein